MAAGDSLEATAQNKSAFAGDGATLRVEEGATLSFTATAAPGWVPTVSDTTVVVDGGAMTVNSEGKKNSYIMFFQDSLDTHGNLLMLTNGATFSSSGSYMRPYVSGTGNRLVVADGASLDVSATVHGAMGLKFHRAQDCELLVTNATVKAYAYTFGNPTIGYDSSTYNSVTYNAVASNNVMRLVDATVQLSSQGQGLSFGALVNENKSFGNTVEIDGNTTVDFCRINMRGSNDVFRVKNGSVSATVSAFAIDGVGNLAEFLGGSYGNSMTANGTNNVVRLAGGVFANTSAKVATRIAGKGNAFEMTAGTHVPALVVAAEAEGAAVRISGGTVSGAFSPGPAGTTYEITGGEIPSMTFADTDENLAFVAEDYMLDAEQTLTLSGANNLYSVGGASCVTGRVEMAGRDNRFVLRDGAKHVSVYRNLSFAEGGVGNVLVLDDAEWEHQGPWAWFYSKGDGIAQNGLTDCAVEFRGAAPKFIVDRNSLAANSTAWGTWYSGTSEDDESGLSTELRWRFVIPAEGWAEAPIQVTGPNPSLFASAQRGPVVQKNTVFEVVLSDELARSRHRSMRVPLWHSDFEKWNSNYQPASGKEPWCGIEALNATAAALGALPEGVTLEFEDMTIYARIPGNIATVIVVR